MDKELQFRAFNHMQCALFGKFLGKALPLDQIKLVLTDLWKGLGSFSVADMTNGFNLIRCQSEDIPETILMQGPWTVEGLVLQFTDEESTSSRLLRS